MQPQKQPHDKKSVSDEQAAMFDLVSTESDDADDENDDEDDGTEDEEVTKTELVNKKQHEENFNKGLCN